MPLQVLGDFRRRHFLQADQQIVGQLAQAMLLPQFLRQVRGEVGGHFGVGHGPVRLAGVRQAGESGEGAEFVVRRGGHQAPGEQQ